MANSCSITLFSEEHCEGDSVIVTQDTEDLVDKVFLNRAKSLIVSGDPWVVFSEKAFKGEFSLFREGNHDTLSDNIASLRRVKGGLEDPEITLYEHIYYGGKVKTFKKDVPSLRAAGMDHMISSHKVKRGAWVLYQQDNYQDVKMVTLAGDEVPNYCDIDWNDKLASLFHYKGV